MAIFGPPYTTAQLQVYKYPRWVIKNVVWFNDFSSPRFINWRVTARTSDTFEIFLPRRVPVWLAAKRRFTTLRNSPARDYKTVDTTTGATNEIYIGGHRSPFDTNSSAVVHQWNNARRRATAHSNSRVALFPSASLNYTSMIKRAKRLSIQSVSFSYRE